MNEKKNAAGLGLSLKVGHYRSKVTRCDHWKQMADWSTVFFPFFLFFKEVLMRDEDNMVKKASSQT